MSARLRTWHLEMFIVATLLAMVLVATRAPWIEIVGSLAVLASFGHASVSDRLAEAESVRTEVMVDCHRWSLRYFVTKELLWLVYFVAHRSWAALAGVGIFLAYPLWRRYWRRRGARGQFE